MRGPYAQAQAPELELPAHLREEADRLERHNRRLDARMRSISLGGRPALGVVAGPDGYPPAGGMETLEGLMDELQVLGGRLGLGGVDGVDGGNGGAVRGAPRAVVGFGAFR